MNQSKSNDPRFWEKWRNAGAVEGYIDAVLRPQDFEPHTVQYVAGCGEVAKTRRLKDIRKVLYEKGFETYKTEDGLLGAVVEHMRGKPSIRNYWDSRGRVCKTEFIGDRGACGTNGITNVYEFDDIGRLTSVNQIIFEKERAPRLYRGNAFIYGQGRPNSIHTHVKFRQGPIGSGGIIKILEYNDRGTLTAVGETICKKGEEPAILSGDLSIYYQGCSWRRWK